MSFLLYYLWIAPQILQGVLLAIVLRRHLGRKFRLFTAYLVFDVSRFLILFALWFISRHGSYMWFGISSEFVSTSLEFGAIYNLSQESVIGPPVVISMLRSWIVFIGAGCMLLAAIVSAMLSPLGQPHHEYVFYTVDLSSSIILTALLLALFAFTHMFGLAWRSQGFGVALGLGVSQSVFLFVAALRPLLDRPAWMLLNYIDLAAYHVCVIIWLVYLIRPERVLQFNGDGLQKTELECWNQELSGMVNREMV